MYSSNLFLVSGATIALGLMYLKSNNNSIASILKIPETAYLLDYVRSDLLLLRTLSRNLIMWDDITPTYQWILSLLPSYFKAGKEGDGPSIESLDSTESFRHARYNIIAGACLGIGIKYAGTGNEIAFKLLLEFMDLFQKASSKAGKLF
jgi:anaphase-promoting complex subunit 1